MTKPPHLINPHRFARLIAWAQAMLGWAALMLFTDATTLNRRHIRQRYCFLSFDRIERIVRKLAIVRAAQLAHLRMRPRPAVRNAAAPGFRRRIVRGGLWRAIGGSRLRRALKHKDPAKRLQRLIAALADIDAFTRRYMLARARRRLTRLCAVLMVAPSPDRILLGPSASPCAANTS